MQERLGVIERMPWVMRVVGEFERMAGKIGRDQEEARRAFDGMYKNKVGTAAGLSVEDAEMEVGKMQMEIKWREQEGGVKRGGISEVCRELIEMLRKLEEYAGKDSQKTEA